jgi:hypothetical protein
LYKLYQITDATKAEAMKKRISAEYPESRYAQIMNNTTANSLTETPKVPTPNGINYTSKSNLLLF